MEGATWGSVAGCAVEAEAKVTLFASILVALVVAKTVWVVAAFISGQHKDRGGPVSGWGTPEG